MTKLEQNLINVIYQSLGIDTSSNAHAIFNIGVDEQFSGYSGEIFMYNGSEYQNVIDIIGRTNWTNVFALLTEPLRAIYDQQQQFVYLIVSYDDDGDFKFTYENFEHSNANMTISNRFIVWEYDEFGIGDRTKSLDKRVLDKYRPLN